MMGCGTSGCSGDDIFDPQVVWNPSANRFFYAADDKATFSDGLVHNLLSFGFSKTTSPNSAADWCKYFLSPYGTAEFPDYPKLGTTKDFLLIGVNAFNTSTNHYRGSDVVWISKPAAGSTCPDASTFLTGRKQNLKTASGSLAFTPVPANQTDSSSTGWIVARPLSLPSTGATSLTVFSVTKSGTAAVIQGTGSNVPVAAYKVPANASQPGTAFKLDTSDARPTQAVSAIDPAHGTAVGLWTQHTVLGGKGAVVRWYEINPASHSLFQSGTVSSTTQYVFNGAIAPDRRVNGTSVKYGSDMVLDYNTSSSTTTARLFMVSKISTQPTSAPILIANSTGPDIGFDCQGGNNICRWGDYAAATPDPAAPTTGATGRVWGTSMLNFPGNGSSANWATWNFAATP